MNEYIKPCLVDTGQGFSVFYQNRHLYSRYNPKRASKAAVSRLVIQPQTLILFLSPLLGYGLEELLSKIPENCFVIGLEADSELYELSKKHIPKHLQSDTRFALVHADSISPLLSWFEQLQSPPVRRCLALDASAGSSLYSDFYREAVGAFDSFISTWWKNRMTIMALGRNYHRNILRNISLLARSKQILKGSINRPILVAGAGPSLDGSISFIQRNRSTLYVLAVDTALAALAQAGITADAVIVLESQYWIEQAFHGFRSSTIPVFADLTARHGAITLPGGPLSLFYTCFDQSSLLNRLESLGLLPLEIPRLGSVGLAALYIARYTASAQTPIFFTGLDFSWQSGFSHSQGAPWPTRDRVTANRLQPAGPQVASPGVYKEKGKKGKLVLTNPSLSGYAQLCANTFSQVAHCYDIGQQGLQTGCPSITHEDAEKILSHCPRGTTNEKELPTQCTSEAISSFLQEEHEKLITLRNSLTGTRTVSVESLLKMIKEHDYLFSHFADRDIVNRLDQSFLNRLRVETQVFIKTIEHQSGLSIF